MTTTLATALAEAAALGIERLDAQLLLLHVLGRSAGDRAWLIAHDGDPLPAEALARLRGLWARRLDGEPLAYLVGQREFHGLEFLVDERVLVPRPETELLVDWALEAIASRRAPRVIDLGTGSGAIAVAIAVARPDAQVEGVDRSPDALQVAAANAARHRAAVALRLASWLDGAAGPYDLIVGNPPYVAAADPHLAALRHEPESALVAGPDGLADLRAIVGAAPALLAPGGWLLLEHGFDQAAAVRQLLAGAGLRAVATRRDLAGIERCTGAQRVELE